MGDLRPFSTVSSILAISNQLCDGNDSKCSQIWRTVAQNCLKKAIKPLFAVGFLTFALWEPQLSSICGIRLPPQKMSRQPSWGAEPSAGDQPGKLSSGRLAGTLAVSEPKRGVPALRSDSGRPGGSSNLRNTGANLAQTSSEGRAHRKRTRGHRRPDPPVLPLLSQGPRLEHTPGHARPGQALPLLSPAVVCWNSALKQKIPWRKLRRGMGSKAQIRTLKPPRPTH